MKQILHIQKLYGPSISTRRTMEEFAKTLVPDDEYLLDFAGVEQISRSSADELYNITIDHKSVRIINMSSFVQKMFDAVVLSRFEPRIRQASKTEIIRCDTMEKVYQCFDNLRTQVLQK